MYEFLHFLAASCRAQSGRSGSARIRMNIIQIQPLAEKKLARQRLEAYLAAFSPNA
jgi:hypothetical protein